MLEVEKYQTRTTVLVSGKIIIKKLEGLFKNTKHSTQTSNSLLSLISEIRVKHPH